MAFGSKNKKRESWSARPLSMILSDNVWLFKNKGRNSMEKAFQQSGSTNYKNIESGKAAPAPAPPASGRPSTSRASLDTTVSYSERRSTEPAAAPVQPAPVAQPPATRKEPTAKPPPAKVDAKAPSEKVGSQEQAPPFLTLNLDLSTQRLDVPEQYLDELTISQEFYSLGEDSSELRATPEPSANASDVGEAILGPLGGAYGQKTATPQAVSSPLTTRTTVSEASDVADATDEALPESNSEPGSQRSNSTWATNAARESTVDSGRSVSTVDAANKSDSFLLGSNRKVVVSRGVYIFDPADPGAVQELQMTAAESFNPFELE